MSDERISTGSFDFNAWLEGGYERGVITMIAGPPASGKTNRLGGNPRRGHRPHETRAR